MSRFYCFDCGICRGFSGINVPTNVTGNSYQVDKYIKHTNPTANYGINSRFDDPNSYCGYGVSASAYGFYEQDGQNRINLIWDANERIGETTDNQGFTTPNSAVKFVHPYAPSRIHGFPTALPATIICSNCDCVIK